MSTEPRPNAAAPAVRRPWLIEHLPFLVALLAGTALRALVLLGFVPALIHSDGPRYLSVIDDLRPSPDRPVGYALLLLRPASLITDDVLLVTAVQHLLGLFTALIVYVLLRRWRVSRWPATMATLPVLLDTLQLNLEHTVLSDSFFELLVLAALAILCWRPHVTAVWAAASGLLLGAAVTVRLVGQPLIAVAVLWCLVAAARGWRGRVVVTAAVLAGFAVPTVAYATWYHAERGPFALSEFTGKALYLRSTSFVDCRLLSVPAYQRVLCPEEPLGARRDPTYYAFHDTRTLPRLHPPPGTSNDEAMRQFAAAAVSAQPVDYARVVARDFLLNFATSRVDAYEYDTAHKWSFEYYLTLKPTRYTGPAYEAHGGRQLEVWQPLADLVVAYGGVGYLPGPLLLGCLLLGLVGGMGVGRARRSGLRPVTWVMTLAGAGLLVVPDLTGEFTWRYQLPALALLPAAAALGWTALRGIPGPSTSAAVTTATRTVPAPWRRPAPTGRKAGSPSTRADG